MPQYLGSLRLSLFAHPLTGATSLELFLGQILDSASCAVHRFLGAAHQVLARPLKQQLPPAHAGVSRPA